MPTSPFDSFEDEPNLFPLTSPLSSLTKQIDNPAARPKPEAMKKSSHFLVLMLAALSASLTAAEASQPHSPVTEDSDLSGATGIESQSVLPFGTTLTPDSVVAEDLATSDRAWIKVIRNTKNGVQPIVGLAIEGSALDAPLLTDETGTAEWSNCAPRTTFRAQIKLKNTHLTVAEDSEPYRFSFQVNCGTSVTLKANEDSPFGQALSIWTLAESARRKLNATVGLDYWTRNLTFIWPENGGDYYSFGTVHISRGDHWDVVLHEMGHAIYDMGKIGAFGGGQHKIDECYSPALALSEGWASYFAAWAAIDLADPDARFEFMVPRRAPIRIENVPADVCKGPTNEWRVTAFLWDLIDTHVDGEDTTTEGFQKLWQALRGSRSASIGAATQKFKASFLPQEDLNRVWEQNFLTSPLQFDSDVLILAPIHF